MGDFILENKNKSEIGQEGEDEDDEEIIFTNPVRRVCSLFSPPKAEGMNVLYSDTAKTNSNAQKPLLKAFSSTQQLESTRISHRRAFSPKPRQCKKLGQNAIAETVSCKVTLDKEEVVRSLKEHFKQKVPALFNHQRECHRRREKDQALQDSIRREHEQGATSTDIASQGDKLSIKIGPLDIAKHQADATLHGYEKFIVSAVEFPTIARNGLEYNRTQIESIINSMERNIQDAEALGMHLRSLHNLSFDDESRDIIGISGGIQITVTMMHVHITNDPLIEQAISFLIDICNTNQNNKLNFGHSGGIQVLINCIQNPLETLSSLVEKVCRALSTFCSSCPTNQILAGKMGACQAILTTMRRRKESMSLQEDCLRVLYHLTLDQSTNIHILTENGGPEEIIATARYFSTEEPFQTTALKLTHSLLRQSPPLRFCLSRTGLIDHLTTTIPLHQTSPTYIISASITLRYLAFTFLSRKLISQTPIIQTLTTILSYHTTPSTLHHILLALGNLTYSPTLSKLHASHPPTLKSLTQIVTTNPRHTLLISQSLRLLRNISDTSPNPKHPFLHPSLPPLIMNSMQCLPGSAPVQEHGAATLINLSRHNVDFIRTYTPQEPLDCVLSLHTGSKSTYKQLAYLYNVLNPPLMGLISRFSRGGSRVSRMCSTVKNVQVESVLSGSAVENAVAALQNDDGSTEY